MKFTKIVFNSFTKIVFKLFKIFVPESIKRELLTFNFPYLNESYSQEGEDLLLNRIFDKSKGFFIDIGAHHPIRFSNTYKLYLKGWTGINIEPAPGTKALFDKLRPKDINLEIGISETEGHLTYYAFNEPALNTFSLQGPQGVQNKNALKDVYIINEIKLKTYPLFKVLDMYMPDNLPIDFMTIDVEGLDLAVLKSNDWTKYRPDYILVEEPRMDVKSIIHTSETYKFLTTKGYTFYARTLNTSLYKKNVAV